MFLKNEVFPLACLPHKTKTKGLTSSCSYEAVQLCIAPTNHFLKTHLLKILKALDVGLSKKPSLFLSLIEPDEWSMIFIGSFKMGSDDKWNKIN